MGSTGRRLTRLMFMLPFFALAFLPGQALAATPPQNTSAPTISTLSGLQPAVGETLVASPGTWTGQPTKYHYEWYECPGGAEGCPSGGGYIDTHHSGNTYAVADSDYAAEIQVQVTAINSSGSQSVTSSAVYISASTPTVIDPPTLSGTPQVGDTLTATAGIWSGFPSPQVFAYTWWDCDASGANCQPNPANLGSTYTLTPADVGYRIQVTVYVDNGNQESAVTNLSGIVTAAPPPTPPLPPSPGSPGGSGPPVGSTNGGTPVSPQAATLPRVIVAPRISGRAKQGHRLSATPGSWSGSPTAFGFTWLDCARNGACRRIRGATRSRYAVRATDVGFRIAVRVTAMNSTGSGSGARSARTAMVRP